jgi:glycerophosphoryl diester phosphodiesterase
MYTKPLVIACRGDRENAPENTLPAFERAISKGVEGIEFDVHYTQDEELIVHHAFNLGLTDNGKGIVSEHTLAELKALDSGEWFGRQFAGESKPTLGEVLGCCKGKVRLEIDMKDSGLDFLRKVIREVERFDLVDEVELTTAHYPLLVHAKKLKPLLRTGTFFYAPEDWKPVRLAQKHTFDWAELLEIDVAHLNIALITPQFVDRLHKRGISVHGSNLDSEEQIQQGLEAGIDGFSTIKLETAIRLRNRHVNLLS